MDSIERKMNWAIQAEKDDISPLVMGHVLGEMGDILSSPPGSWEAVSDLLGQGEPAGGACIARLLGRKSLVFAAFAEENERRFARLPDLWTDRAHTPPSMFRGHAYVYAIRLLRRAVERGRRPEDATLLLQHVHRHFSDELMIVMLRLAVSAQGLNIDFYFPGPRHMQEAYRSYIVKLESERQS